MSTQPLQFLLLFFAGWVNRQQADVIAYLKEENRALREKLGPKPIRLNKDQRRRLAVKGKLLGRKVLREVAAIATPDTILRWYRKLVADKYDGSRNRARGPGRRRTKEEIRLLVVRMAVENVRWGYTRIRGALHNLGVELGRNTIKRILLEHGIERAPERGKRMPWKTFLRAHWGEIAAADFFTVEVLTLVGLVRYHVLFVIDLETRRVQIAGIVHNPGDAWMAQAARNLVDVFAGFLKDHRYIILDRDPLYTKQFRSILASSGVKTVRLPARSPDLNSYAERFVLSIKSECLNHIVPLGVRHLRRAVAQFVEHYHFERNHQGLDNNLIVPQAQPVNDNAPIVCRERLGGLLKHYVRAA
jgi:transposase InsO family protein